METAEIGGIDLVFAILAAILPAFVMLAYVLWYDRNHPEPSSMLFKGFVCGVLSLGVLNLFWDYFPAYFEWADQDRTVIGKIKYAFCSVAFAEEGVKLIMLWILLSKNPFFDERFDGIVYAVSVSMGFAAFENLDYVLDSKEWGEVAAIRAVLTVPMHYMCGVLMGYFYSLAKYDSATRWKRLWHWAMIWVGPVIIHGTFDAIAMNAFWNNYAYIILTISLFVFCFFTHKYCNHLLHKHLIKDIVERKEKGKSIEHQQETS